MPRLDNSNPHNLAVLQEWGGVRWDDVAFDPEDPGDMPPMDVCSHCLEEYFPWEDGAVEHPPYDSLRYTCAVCADELGEDDD